MEFQSPSGGCTRDPVVSSRIHEFQLSLGESMSFQSLLREQITFRSRLRKSRSFQSLLRALNFLRAGQVVLDHFTATISKLFRPSVRSTSSSAQDKRLNT